MFAQWFTVNYMQFPLPVRSYLPLLTSCAHNKWALATIYPFPLLPVSLMASTVALWREWLVLNIGTHHCKKSCVIQKINYTETWHHGKCIWSVDHRMKNEARIHFLGRSDPTLSSHMTRHTHSSGLKGLIGILYVETRKLKLQQSTRSAARDTRVLPLISRAAEVRDNVNAVYEFCGDCLNSMTSCPHTHKLVLSFGNTTHRHSRGPSNEKSFEPINHYQETINSRIVS